MRLLVTRPEAEARAFAAALAAEGVESVVAPLLAIVPVGPAPLDLAGVQALLVTSANGARALAARTVRRDLPALAVGTATARALVEAGFADVRDAGGDAAALAALAARSLDPARGALLWASGEDTAGAPDAALAAHGFAVRRIVLYRAAAAAALPEAARRVLAADALDGVALFSPRSAEILLALVAAADLAPRCARLDAYCLSDAVAAPLRRDAAGIPWRRVRVAERPETDSLLRLIRGTMTDMAGPDSMSDSPKPENAAPTGAAPAGAAPMGAGTDAAADARREAERIVSAFGGIRPMAKILGVPVTTVQGWKERGAIPIARLADVRAAAARAGIDLDAAPAARTDKVEAVDAEPVVAAPKSGVRDADAATGAGGSEPPRPADPPPTVEARAAAPSDALSGAPPPARNRPLWFGIGFGGAFAAGLVAAWFLGPVFGGRGPDPAALAALDGRVRALQNQIDEAARRAQAESQALQQRLARIDATERALRDQSERLANLAAQSMALATRLEQMDEALKRLAASAPPNADEMRALRDLVQRLAARVDAMPQGAGDPAAAQRLAEALKELGDKLAALDARVAALAAGDPAKAAAEARALAQKLEGEMAALRQAVAAQGERLAALAAESGRRAAESDAPLVVAVGQLRAAAERGQPFRPALDAVAALARDRPGFKAPLDALAPHAGTGAKTLAALRRDFDRIGVSAQRAAERAAEGDWIDRAWARLVSLVSVRRTGEAATGDGPGALVSRAEAALARGDLAAALAALEKLPPAGRAAAAAWMAEARARAAVDTALAALDRLAIDLISGAGKGEPPKKP
jgi:uroporphyrinogen-III synthase